MQSILKDFEVSTQRTAQFQDNHILSFEKFAFRQHFEINDSHFNHDIPYRKTNQWQTNIKWEGTSEKLFDVDEQQNKYRFTVQCKNTAVRIGTKWL